MISLWLWSHSSKSFQSQLDWQVGSHDQSDTYVTLCNGSFGTTSAISAFDLSHFSIEGGEDCLLEWCLAWSTMLFVLNRALFETDKKQVKNDAAKATSKRMSSALLLRIKCLVKWAIRRRMSGFEGVAIVVWLNSSQRDDEWTQLPDPSSSETIWGQVWADHRRLVKLCHDVVQGLSSPGCHCVRTFTIYSQGNTEYCL